MTMGQDEADRRSIALVTTRVVQRVAERATWALRPEGPTLASGSVFHRHSHPGEKAIPLDQFARDSVTQAVAEEFGPDAAVGGEEHGWQVDGRAHGTPIVITDPLDGSTNLWAAGGPWSTNNLLYREGVGLVAGAVGIPGLTFAFDRHGCASLHTADGAMSPAGRAGAEASLLSALRLPPPSRVVVAGVASSWQKLGRLGVWAEGLEADLKAGFPETVEYVRVLGVGGAPTVGHVAYGGLDVEVKLDRSAIYDAAHLPFHAAHGNVVVDLDSGHFVDFHTILTWFDEISEDEVVPRYVVSKRATLADFALDRPPAAA